MVVSLMVSAIQSSTECSTVTTVVPTTRMLVVGAVTITLNAAVSPAGRSVTCPLGKTVAVKPELVCDSMSKLAGQLPVLVNVWV